MYDLEEGATQEGLSKLPDSVAWELYEIVNSNGEPGNPQSFPDSLSPFIGLFREAPDVYYKVVEVYNPQEKTFSEAVLKPLLKDFPNLYLVVSANDCLGKPKKLNKGKILRFINLVYLCIEKSETLRKLDSLLPRIKDTQQKKQIVKLFLLFDGYWQGKIEEWRNELLEMAENMIQQNREFSIERLVARYIYKKFSGDIKEGKLEEALGNISKNHRAIFFPVIYRLADARDLKHVIYLLEYLSLSDEEYRERRYQMLDLPARLKTARMKDYEQSISVEGEHPMKFIFTEDPELLFRMGKAPMINTCIARDSDNPSKRSLAGFIATPWVKMATLLDDNGSVLGRMNILLLRKDDEYFVMLDGYYGMRNLESVLRNIIVKILLDRKEQGLIGGFNNIGDGVSFLPGGCCSIVVTNEIRLKGSESYMIGEISLGAGGING